MNRKDADNMLRMINRLQELGISTDDAWSLRRISMTLHRWFELECGDGNNYGSWAIERDDNGDGPPFMVHHHYMHGRGKDYTTRTRIADREKGAKARLAKIMAKHPTLEAYIQGDPRGAPLYIVRKQDIPEGATIDSCYNRGVVIHK